MARQYVTPPTFTDGTPFTAQDLNRYLADNLEMLEGPWVSYPVEMHSWGLVNGTLKGWVSAAGKIISGRIEYTVGSSDTKSSAPYFTFPFPQRTPFGACIGNGGLYDGVNREFWFALRSTLIGGAIALARDNDQRITTTVPWTWATGDQMMIDYQYEAT